FFSAMLLQTKHCYCPVKIIGECLFSTSSFIAYFYGCSVEIIHLQMSNYHMLRTK
ncbi:hypothetical protein L9F63_024199, partial [Diploptera punctata]